MAFCSDPRAMPAKLSCPCGGAAFDACCGRFLSGTELPPTAEALMRSRYTAYVQNNEAYLQATWHPSTRPAAPVIDQNDKLQWLGLEVKSALRLRQRKAEAGPGEDFVEFVARYRIDGRGHRLHEISRFQREAQADGTQRWFYVDGTFPDK
jgi:SEC-C motif-containing protein